METTLHFWKKSFQDNEDYNRSKRKVYLYMLGKERKKDLTSFLLKFKKESVEKILANFFCDVLSEDRLISYFDHSAYSILELFDNAGLDVSFFLEPSTLEDCKRQPSQERWRKTFLPIVQKILRGKYVEGMRDVPLPKELNATIRSLLLGSRNVREEQKLVNSTLEQSRMMGFKGKRKSRKGSGGKGRKRKSRKGSKSRGKKGKKSKSKSKKSKRKSR